MTCPVYLPVYLPYALGYYRPGNCAPYLIEPLGTSPRAVVWQAGAVVGFSALVP